MSQFIPQVGDRIASDIGIPTPATVVGVNGRWFWVEWDDGRHYSFNDAERWHKVETEVTA